MSYMESFKKELFDVASHKNHLEDVITRPSSETVVALENITEFSHTTNTEKKSTFLLHLNFRIKENTGKQHAI